ncbi:MAG: hypothetical protein HZB10_02710 [Candidatus Yonathbacteria bacterium]|nr:hypothetical protein [Candidatus Yonathbacteria bacterium]
MKSIILRKHFEKKYSKLPNKIKDAFKERRNLFLENMYSPILDNHPVDKAYPGCRSIDITGDYRAIFFEDGEAVTFVAIGTHAQLYK